MAALAGMTVVVEAAERSGSLITAEMAQEAGRDVGAVPGPVNSWRSQGTNALLHDGAHVVRGAGDVLDVMLGAGARSALARGPRLDPPLQVVLGHVEAGRRSADEVALAVGGDAGATASALARLELLGYVRSDLTGTWSRTQLAEPDRQQVPP
jgi:DNA processing protein